MVTHFLFNLKDFHTCFITNLSLHLECAIQAEIVLELELALIERNKSIICKKATNLPIWKREKCMPYRAYLGKLKVGTYTPSLKWAQAAHCSHWAGGAHFRLTTCACINHHFDVSRPPYSLKPLRFLTPNWLLTRLTLYRALSYLWSLDTTHSAARSDRTKLNSKMP